MRLLDRFEHTRTTEPEDFMLDYSATRVLDAFYSICSCGMTKRKIGMHTVIAWASREHRYCKIFSRSGITFSQRNSWLIIMRIWK